MKKKDLLKILSCPICFSELKEVTKGLTCQKCQKIYLVIKNRPIFIDQANQLKAGVYEKFKYDKKPINFKEKIISSFLKYYYPSERDENIKKLIRNQSQDSLTLNLGGGNEELGFKREVNVDINQFPKVDVVADAKQLPFREGLFDLVIADALLEHVGEPNSIIREIYRVLKKRGKVYATIPFLQRYHSSPADFTRWTTEGLSSIFGKFKTIEKEVTAGAGVSFLEFNIEALRLISRGNKILFLVLLFIFFPLFTVFKLFFYFIPKDKEHILANGFYFIGQKVIGVGRKLD